MSSSPGSRQVSSLESTVTEESHNISNTNEETIIPVTADLQTRHVSFAPSVIDNEDMNKKKSKICCIYHPKDIKYDNDNIPKDFPNAYER